MGINGGEGQWKDNTQFYDFFIYFLDYFYKEKPPFTYHFITQWYSMGKRGKCLIPFSSFAFYQFWK